MVLNISHSTQVFLISIGVLLIALVLKNSVPLVLDFSIYQAPVIYSSLASWLRPPYLYVIINLIIITIVASSRFHRTNTHANQANDHQHHNHHYHHELPPVPKTAADFTDGQFHYEDSEVVKDSSAAEIRFGAVVESTAVDKAVIVSDVVVANGSVEEAVYKDDDEFMISRSDWVPPPKRHDSSENPPEVVYSSLAAEKPLVSARFGHRKPVRASPEGGRELRVSKPKRHETLENTWKAITEGRPIPLTRHLKKLDTWENNGRQQNIPLDTSPQVPKSETFKDRTNYQAPPLNSSPASGRLRKEPSLSQEELNRQVEAFIKKFNEEMRLQRQESLNQYKEMMMIQ